MSNPLAPLLFDADEKFIDLTNALRSVAKVVRVLTDPCLTGALPAWQTAVAGTMSYSNMSGANSIGQNKITCAASGGAQAVIRNAGTLPGSGPITPSNFVALAWTLEGITFDADTGFDFWHGFFPEVTNTGGVILRQSSAQMAADSSGFIELWTSGTTQVMIPRQITDAVLVANSATITSATANFTSADIGQPIGMLALPGGIIPGATIIAVGSTTSATMSMESTAAGTAQSVQIGQQPYFRMGSPSGGGRWRKSITALWLPQQNYFYYLRDDQVVAEINLTGLGVSASSPVYAETDLISSDGSAHYYQWEQSKLILAHN